MDDEGSLPRWRQLVPVLAGEPVGERGRRHGTLAG
jgi:hypothetical protein